MGRQLIRCSKRGYHGRTLEPGFSRNHLPPRHVTNIARRMLRESKQFPSRTYSKLMLPNGVVGDLLDVPKLTLLNDVHTHASHVTKSGAALSTHQIANLEQVRDYHFLIQKRNKCHQEAQNQQPTPNQKGLASCDASYCAACQRCI